MNKNSNIILIGMMGSGKTQVGQALQELSGFKFIDTDAHIERQTLMKIKDIFLEHGEDYFRGMESYFCKKLANFTQTIISTGGGMVLNPENRTQIKNSGLVVWLKTDSSTIYNRIKDDTNRPLLNNVDNLKEEIENKTNERNPIYESISDEIIETDNQSITTIAKEIWQKYSIYNR